MNQTIIHIDMDAFFAAVEVRDNPALAGKPLIIGALPQERGVVSTCSYEARKFGIHSAMSIKDAYKRCPHGIYMHPSMSKYKEASDHIHDIWSYYTNIAEYISLDEGYLDVTGSIQLFGSAKNIAEEIKKRTKEETGLTCSVGIGYSMASAKFASEEKKPDGFFEVPDADFFKQLIMNRGIRVISGAGRKTVEKLESCGFRTVRDILVNEKQIIAMLGNHGRQIIEMANGIDTRKVTPFYDSKAKSIGREHTFQHDTTDFKYLKDMLRMLAKELSLKLRRADIRSQTITLKITYENMQSITRSKSRLPTNQADDIYATASDLIDTIEKRPIRLVGISLSHLTEGESRQLSLDDIIDTHKKESKKSLDDKLLSLQQKFGADIIKTGSELVSEKHLEKKD